MTQLIMTFRWPCTNVHLPLFYRAHSEVWWYGFHSYGAVSYPAFFVFFFFLANLTFLPAKTQGACLLTPFASFMRSHLSACHSGGSTEQKPQPVCGRARECPCLDLWKSILICGRGDCSVVLESRRNAGGSTWVMMKCKTKPNVFSSKW